MLSIKKKLLINTISNGFQFGARWLQNLLFAKWLSADMFGSFSLVYTIASLVSTLFIFGSNLYLLSNIDDNNIESLSDSIVILCCLFVVLFILGIFCVAFSIISCSSQEFVIYILSLFLSFTWALNTILFSFLKGKGFFMVEATAYLFFSISSLIFLILFYFLDSTIGAKLVWIFIFLVISNALPLIKGYSFLRSEFNISLIDLVKHFYNSIKNVGSIFQCRIFYGLHELQSILFTNLPFLLLSFFISPAKLGCYRAIYVLIFPVQILPVIISQVMSSHLSSISNDVVLFRKIFRKFLIINIIVGVVVFFVYSLFADYAISYIYKDKYNTSNSSLLLNIFIITALAWFVKSSYENVLTILKRQWLRVLVLWIMIILFPLLTFIIPVSDILIRYSVSGLIATMLMMIIYIVYTERLIFNSKLNSSFS